MHDEIFAVQLWSLAKNRTSHDSSNELCCQEVSDMPNEDLKIFGEVCSFS